MILFYLYSLRLKDFKQHCLFHIFSLLQDAGEKYAKAVEELAFKLLEVIVSSMGLRTEGLDGFFKDQKFFLTMGYH